MSLARDSASRVCESLPVRTAPWRQTRQKAIVQGGVQLGALHRRAVLGVVRRVHAMHSESVAACAAQCGEVDVAVAVLQDIAMEKMLGHEESCTGQQCHGD